MKAITHLLCIFILLAAGCKKDRHDPDDEKPIVDHDVQGVKVSFPAGASVNYTDYSLFSLADDAKLDGSGNANVSYNKGNTNIAWLFDKNNNPVMAGFVNDTITAIDAVSTAKVLLYYAYAIPMMPQSLSDEFVNTIGGVAGFSDLTNQLSALMKADRLVLSKNGHLKTLEDAMKAMGKKNTAKTAKAQSWGKQLGINSQRGHKVAVRNADITVTTSDVKSGIQVFSDALSKVKMTNYYRRRAHAFFYKMKFKDLAGIEKGVLSEINETTASDKDESVSPTSAINSFTGVLGNWIENRNSGEVLDFAAKQAGPYDFPLQDNESEATYKVRVVGPGAWPTSVKLTNAEKSKLFRLEVETFAMDFLIPVTASFISSKVDAKPGKNATEREKEEFGDLVEAVQKVVEEMIKGSPAVYEEMKAGNYKEALTKLMESVYAGNASAAKEGFVKVMAILARNAVEQKYYVSPQYDEVLAQNKMMKILEVTDKVLELSDYATIFYDILGSKSIEGWDLLLKGGKVTLKFVAGYDSLLNTSEETKIIADIKNMNETGGEQHPYYEWSTTGKYGKLVDTKGHSGTSFASADHIVSYQSTSSSSVLQDGDNIDYIYVKASFNNVVIGMDTIAVNVKKVTYEMKPTDATVTGKKHTNAANTVTVHLAKAVTGLRDIPNHESLDFKIEWSTSGVYGNLLGETTTYNKDEMQYKATNDQVGVFTETITAKIYAKRKDETEYWFYDQIKGKVKIDNEQKKKILKLPLTQFHGDSEEPWNYGDGKGVRTLHLCIRHSGVSIPEDEDAVSYSVRFHLSYVLIGAPLFQSWKAGDPSPSPPGKTPYPGHGGGYYNVTYAGSSANSDPLKGIKHVKEGGLSGSYAIVTIYLK